MSPDDFVYVVCAFVATVLIPSVPSLIALRGAGPQYRRAILRSLCVGWSCAALFAGWLVLGWFALGAGPRWMNPYRDFTLVLMGAWFTLLPLAIWRGNRALRAALEADRASATGAMP